MEEIKKNIRTIFSLTSKEADIFLSKFHKIELQKNDIFISEGELCDKVGLIEKGLMVCVYHKDGNEIIDEFAYENSFITNYYSLLTQTSSLKEIRCIEDTTIYVTTREKLESLSQFPFIEKMAATINEKLFLRTHDRVKSLLLDSATERYIQLISQRQDLAQRIPQFYLASFLNIKPETLSRIRKKISQSSY